MDKSYNPHENEPKIYKKWQKAGYFNPDSLNIKKTAKKYTIVMPPPNITGELHMGHALNTFIQDILIRRKRMQGYKTLLLPGTDHAGIATQNKVEKQLKKEGLSRHDLGKEDFLKRVWQWKKEYGHIILDQLKKLGCSADWSRTAFTMDKQYQKAVKEAFLYYYKKGWIYQGERVINWCPRCQTSLSDLELEYEEREGQLWYIKYPLKKQKDKYVTVATTRPETMLGDTAVAVNPNDKRYKDLIGETLILPIIKREIPIIADKSIDTDFGTGALKVTPAHSQADSEIASRHNLESVKIINEIGKINQNAGKEFEGLKTKEAREIIIEKLKNQNLIKKTEKYIHNIPLCYRCNTVIEPLASKQWFLKMTELAKKAKKEVKTGRIKFHPKRWEKLYFDWLDNIHDWCISRQIWWGHKVPIKGETDVLDTWFSSALWPFATLGWPEKTKDLKEFYPTQTLVTARDIINLWVARMIFSGMEFMGKKPFDDVIIHATILAKNGQRMSKSLGTGVNPLDLIDKYGSDATRFGLIYQAMGQQDIHFSEEDIVMAKRFSNKIWNASRFVMMQIGENYKTKPLSYKQITSPQFQSKLTSADKKIIKKFHQTVKSINKDLDNFNFGQAAHKIYDYFWHDLCDNYIEAAKEQKDESTKKILAYILINSLKLIHPFLPFTTESIYQKLPFKQKEMLIIEEWPKQ